MLFLVNDIMDFAQIENNKLLLSIEMLSFRDLIEQCMGILQF